MVAGMPPTREEIRGIVLLIAESKQAHEAATQSNNKATEVFHTSVKPQLAASTEKKKASEWADEILGCLNYNIQVLEQWAQSHISSDLLVATLLKAVPKQEVNVEVELPSQPSLAGSYDVSEMRHGRNIFETPVFTRRTIEVKKS
jgi:hypothetical protein